MTMIEKMARAIAQVDHNGRIAGEGYWRDADTGSGHHIKQARAALAMMLEPSAAMIAAGEEKGGRAWDYTGSTRVVNPDLGFRAMIQAALEEA